MHPQMLMRQMDILPINYLGFPITLIGAGAIGSVTTVSLAKMGFSNITVFDDDIIEPENMNCQFYPLRCIGLPKVEVLQNMVRDFADVEIEIKKERYKEGAFPGIVISAVDNMETRKLIWNEHKAKGFNTRAVIDPRMGGEAALLYIMEPMKGTDITSYEKTLYSDDEAMPERCTAKSTMYTTQLLAGLVCKGVKDLVLNAPYTRILQWDIARNQAVGLG